jgi:hypothetical protein
MKFKIINSSLLADYKTQMRSDSAQTFYNLSESPLSADTFSFYTSVSAVFSSKIEGEPLALYPLNWIFNAVICNQFFPSSS